ncbi:hypothetical protein SDRG_16713 [Saprolegnia diclina VS20]|uniref:Uncharacterized protein n=1 Tax=Saprolegnia diclina (strain VS20) TaxID=1156394 RepID=T0PWM8_SAPDV|nr:hypothetical protein SDRG_16713 [Saprolegnia diclina VS20]EQC25425.1 hypothetical protein SDRG_16713 [Saprolegnia diclina VS20]|eukprot:XP_008621153.1 hypothetical protein SDRG_16713 [Saprolegnia diclina VS20]
MRKCIADKKKDKEEMEGNKVYYEKNHKQVRGQQKAYIQKNKAARQAKNTSWRLANRAPLAAYKRTLWARKKAIAAGEIPSPMLELADFGARNEAVSSVLPAAPTGAALTPVLIDKDDDVLHGATTKRITMVSFTIERPQLAQSATNTVLLAGTYMCTFCGDWTYYRRHGKRTNLDALAA